MNKDQVLSEARILLRKNDLEGVRRAIQVNSWLLTSKRSLFGTLLHVACWEDKPQMVELLLSLGADVNVLNEEDETPLKVGVNNKPSLETVKILIRHGADLNYGQPLYAAYYAGKNHDVVFALLNAGARSGANKILRSAVLNGEKQLEDMLIACGANAEINPKKHHQKFLSFWAREKNMPRNVATIKSSSPKTKETSTRFRKTN